MGFTERGYFGLKSPLNLRECVKYDSKNSKRKHHPLSIDCSIQSLAPPFFALFRETIFLLTRADELMKADESAILPSFALTLLAAFTGVPVEATPLARLQKRLHVWKAFAAYKRKSNATLERLAKMRADYAQSFNGEEIEEAIRTFKQPAKQLRRALDESLELFLVGAS